MAMAFTPQVLCRPTGFLKLIEIALAIVCLILIREYTLKIGNNYDQQLAAIICIGGMVLVTAPILIAYIFGEASIEKTILETLDNFMGFVLFVVAGSLLIHNYHEISESERGKAGLGCGSVAIINGLIYLIDMVFAHRNRRL